jgi:hypothetical protein
VDTIYTSSPTCRGLDVTLNRPQRRIVLLDRPAPSQMGTPLQVGSAKLQAVIDTLGHVEPGSIEVVYSTCALK